MAEVRRPRATTVAACTVAVVPELLSDRTTLRLGGPAGRLMVAQTADELVQTVADADTSGEPVLLVGGGSNLVVGDDGWPGVVVVVGNTGTAVEHELRGGQVTVTLQAGEVWDQFVALTIEQGWGGLATMSGIPGLIGATPIQNVGAYGAEIADVLAGVTVFDRHTKTIESWDPERCRFGFRTSAFKHTDRYVILDVTVQLDATSHTTVVRYLELARRLGVEPGTAVDSATVRAEVLALRASKGMVLDESDHDTWSVGSFFVNPFVAEDEVPEGCPNWRTETAADPHNKVKLSAAWLIENAGFARGFGLDRGDGRVSVSTKHTLALTNRGGATTTELLELAAVIRDGVEERFGVRLRPEAHLAGITF